MFGVSIQASVLNCSTNIENFRRSPRNTRLLQSLTKMTIFVAIINSLSQLRVETERIATNRMSDNDFQRKFSTEVTDRKTLSVSGWK